MKTKRKVGGQFGNLNASKNPWTAWWTRRALKDEHRWILPILQDYADDLKADKPGMSSGEERMCELAQIARGCVLLILGEIVQKGLSHDTNNGWDLHPGAKELARFLNVERTALMSLGLERRASKPKSLHEMLEGQATPVPLEPSEPSEPTRTPPPVVRKKLLV